MKEIEVEGKTVTLAVEKGLADLGLRRDQVEVQILQEAAPGFLGLGAKLARVRIREKIWSGSELPKGAASSSLESQGAGSAAPAGAGIEEGKERQHAPAPRRSRPDLRRRPADSRTPSSSPTREPYRGSSFSRPSSHGSASRSAGTSGEPFKRPVVHEAPPDTALACSETKLAIEELLKLLQIADSTIKTSWDGDQVRVRAEIETADKEALLADNGRFLESLQFLITLIASRRVKHPVAVQVDTGDYWREKEDEVILQVHQAMEMVKRTNQPVRLKPMDAVMRRLVHRTLAKHPEFETTSEGEGMWRKVVLRPKKK